MNEHMRAVPTLPRLLSEHGYVSLQTGKWWQGHYSEGGFTHGMTRGQRHGDDGLKIGRETLKPIEDFIDEATSDKKPWMVWYAPLLPHDPHTPPKEYLDRMRPLAPTEHVAKYWAMVEWFDATVGQLLEGLDRRGLSDNTIVVYVTDNGWIQDPNSTRYAPKSKQSPYDGGVRTPIMIRWPGHWASRESPDLAHSIDLVPTLLTAIGAKIPEGLLGIDLSDEERTRQRSAVYGECFTHNANDLDDPRENLRWRWIVRGEWKLIVPNESIEKGSSEELYHLSSDPLENHNLREEQSAIARDLLRELDQWWK
jgi:arylsulfatase A-like enzyme